LHDDTLERTTSGHGLASQLNWAQLATLDAGHWHSEAFTAEPLPTLATVAAWCQNEGHALNIEIKPSPGQAHTTGSVVAEQAQQLWMGQPVAPLLTSFDIVCLEAARQAAPELPRGLLLSTWPDDAWSLAQELGCKALVAHHALWTAPRIAQAHQLGLYGLSYTVNDIARASQLLHWGLDGIITDQVDAFSPHDQKSPLRTGKPKASQSSMPPR
jgi:glycerophosphoryl diester phosphodiesterase